MKKLLFVMVLVVLNVILASAQSRSLQQRDGFQWYLIKGNGYEGAQDINGNTIIPLSRQYRTVAYMGGYGDPPLFIVTNQNGTGACTVSGQEIIPPKYPSLIYDGSFKYRYSFSEEYKSLGISLNSQGAPIYQSSTNGSEAAAVLVGAVLVGAAIVGGVAAAVNSSSSRSSSSSSNNKASTNTRPHPVITSKDNVDIIAFGYSMGGYTTVKIRNKNSYDVYVTLEAGFLYEGETHWTELDCISSGYLGKAACVRAGSVVEATFVGVRYRADYISIISVR